MPPKGSQLSLALTVARLPRAYLEPPFLPHQSREDYYALVVALTKVVEPRDAIEDILCTTPAI